MSTQKASDSLVAEGNGGQYQDNILQVAEIYALFGDCKRPYTNTNQRKRNLDAKSTTV